MLRALQVILQEGNFLFVKFFEWTAEAHFLKCQTMKETQDFKIVFWVKVSLLN